MAEKYVCKCMREFSSKNTLFKHVDRACEHLVSEHGHADFSKTVVYFDTLEAAEEYVADVEFVAGSWSCVGVRKGADGSVEGKRYVCCRQVTEAAYEPNLDTSDPEKRMYQVITSSQG